MAYVLVAWSAPDAQAPQVESDLVAALRNEELDPVALLPRLLLYRDGDVAVDFVRGLVQTHWDEHDSNS